MPIKPSRAEFVEKRPDERAPQSMLAVNRKAFLFRSADGTTESLVYLSDAEWATIDDERRKCYEWLDPAGEALLREFFNDPETYVMVAVPCPAPDEGDTSPEDKRPGPPTPNPHPLPRAA